MKTGKKILRCIIALIFIAGILSAWRFTSHQNKVKEYSTYCMDAVRAELGEYIGNIHMNDSFCSEGTCVYMGGVSYEGVDYSYSCKVYNKENIELSLDPLYLEEEIVMDEPEIEEEPIENESEVNETEIDETEIEGTSTNEDMPIAKMRVLEGQTEEETQAMVEEACSNMGGTWMDGSCVLEDGSSVNF